MGAEDELLEAFDGEGIPVFLGRHATLASGLIEFIYPQRDKED